MYHLLIVDDEKIVRQGIIRCIDFEVLGIGEIYEAENGMEALKIVEDKEVDFILADINMPRMNGLEFAKAAKNINKKIKLAFITGYDYFEYAREALKIGADDYVLKPVSKKDIYEILSRMIEKKKEEMGTAKLREVVERLTKNDSPNISNGEDKTAKEVIMNKIEGNIANKNFSLNMLAEELGFSTGYFSSMFKKLFNINFREYLLNLRLEKAKILILSTNLKNYEVAEAIGIDDPNYFSACFKKKYGMTVTDYRNNMGSGK